MTYARVDVTLTPRGPRPSVVPGAGSVIDPYLLDGPAGRPWWPPLRALDHALGAGDAAGAAAAYAAATRALFAEAVPDLPTAVAEAVVLGTGTWCTVVEARTARTPTCAGGPWEPGVTAAARADLGGLSEVVRRAWGAEVAAVSGAAVPEWRDLAPAREGVAAAAAATLAAQLADGAVDAAWETVRDAAERFGAGPLAGYEAYAWDGDRLRGLDRPAPADHGSLVGVEEQLGRLVENVEAFLGGRPALATLLYGPRGSGKSTAVRGLLPRFAGRGLRLVELPGASLDALPRVLAELGRRPHHHVLFLDDLAVDHDDARLRPLKSVLDGSLRGAAPRVLVVATSNRRHLVQERFSDRPAAGDGDVHAWDTHHDRLALADRFGLTITFPGTDARAYLAIVRALAAAAGLRDEGLEERALRFASWGNGPSGRTARQFVDTLRRQAEGP